MGSQMRAFVFHGKEDVRVQQVEVPPPPGEGRVKVKPIWCGICGTDLHEYLGGPNLCPTTPHPITGEKVPLTFGHEFSAIVEEVGPGVRSWKPGDRVSVEPIIWDGTCVPCQKNCHNACDKGGFIGLSGWGGGLSEHCVVPETSLYRIPDSVSMEIGAMIEPLAVGWHAVKVSPFEAGDNVMVLGGGPIGLSVLQALKAKGAGKIIVSETAEKRKEFARTFGADYILDPSKDDVPAKAKEIADGEGPAVVFDCAGVQAGLDVAIEALRVRGTLVNIAIWEKGANIMPTKILLKEKKYQGVITYARGDFEEVLQACADGRIKPEPMITKKVKLENIVEEGFMALINDKANQVKILVDPQPS